MSETLQTLLVVFLGGALTTYVWRFLGVMLAERVDPQSEFLMWVRSVATAIVAALCAGIVLSPNRILALTSLEARIAAIAVGVICFYVFRRNTGAGVAAAVLALFVFSGVLAV
jgi:branched-subunit amino acid transport protein